MALSISPASRIPNGLNTTPNDGAADSIAVNIPLSAAEAGSRKDPYSFHGGYNLFQQLQPFPAQAVFEIRKPGGVSAWVRQTVDEAGANRIDDTYEHDWHRAGHLL